MAFRPNYFAAMEISDTNIVKEVRRVQTEISRENPEYRRFQNPENGLHLTLGLFSMPGTYERDACVAAMREITPQLRKLAEQSPPIQIKGVGNFGTNVAYADVVPTREIKEISAHIKKAMREKGIEIDGRDSNFHLTMFKATRSASLPHLETVLKPYEGANFGQQSIDNVQICKMGTLGQGERGFYRSIFGLNM